MLGNRTRGTVGMSSCAPPFRTAEFDVLFGQGISYVGDLLDLGVNAGIVEKSGAWYSYGETRLGQGRDKSIEFLKSNPDLLAKVEAETRMALGMTDVPEDEEAAAPEAAAVDRAKEAPPAATAAASAGASAAASAGNGRRGKA